MAEQKCTIFASTPNYELVGSTVAKTAAGAQVSVGNKIGDKITVRSKTGALVINTQQKQFNGDEFSAMILGMYNLAEDSQDGEEKIEKTQEFILNCKFALGIIANPAFSQTDERLDIVFNLAEKLNGLIFNGRRLLNYQGETVMQFSDAK